MVIMNHGSSHLKSYVYVYRYTSYTDTFLKIFWDQLHDMIISFDPKIS